MVLAFVVFVYGGQLLRIILLLLVVAPDRTEEALAVQMHHFYRRVVSFRQFFGKKVQVFWNPDSLQHSRLPLVHLQKVSLVHPL